MEMTGNNQAIEYDELHVTIKNRWVLGKRLGVGSYGIVEQGMDMITRTPVAIKVDTYYENPSDLSVSMLRKEFEILKILSMGVPENETIGFPKAIYYASSDYMRVMILELLGDTVHTRLGRNLISLAEVYNVGIQMLDRLEHLHNCGYLHLDIKADNILFGREDKHMQIYLNDFGLAQRYLDKNRRHRKNKKLDASLGVSNFNSLDMMNRNVPARKDDVESLSYVLIYLYFKALPWMNKRIWHNRHEGRQARGTHVLDTNNSLIVFEEFAPSMEVNHDVDIAYVKSNYPLERLAEGMPGMLEFLQHVRGLKYDEKPSYAFLRKALRRKIGRRPFPGVQL